MPFDPRQTHKLRNIAEQQLEKTHERSTEPPSDTLKILHELQVHQIELEMQGKELADTLALCDALRSKYHDLYTHAPVTYLTVSPQGKIFEANIAGGKLFGMSPSALTGRDVRALFCEEGLQDVGALFNRLQGSTEDVFAYAVQFKKQPIPRYVNIQARAYQDPVLGENRVSVVLMDVTALKSATEDVCSAISDFGRLG